MSIPVQKITIFDTSIAESIRCHLKTSEVTSIIRDLSNRCPVPEVSQDTNKEKDITTHWCSTASKLEEALGPAWTSRLSRMTYPSKHRNLIKSQWLGFSTSMTPQGYCRPRTFLPPTSNTVVEPTTANGTASFSCRTYNVSKQVISEEMHMLYLCWCLVNKTTPYEWDFNLI